MNPSYDDLWDAWAASEHDAYEQSVARKRAEIPADSRMSTLRAMAERGSVGINAPPAACNEPMALTNEPS